MRGCTQLRCHKKLSSAGNERFEAGGRGFGVEAVHELLAGKTNKWSQGLMPSY
jgi:hypothetical protein